MPTIFSHAVFAAATGRAYVRGKTSPWFWVLAALCAIVPDADVVGRSFGVESGTMLAHRGLTHSVFFALFFGSAAALFARRFISTEISLAKSIVFFSLATFSHPLLDMLTNGGRGVALLAPFSNERFFFPWRPVEVSPIGLKFFGPRGVEVILSEIVWIWLPAGAILLAVWMFERKKRR